LVWNFAAIFGNLLDCCHETDRQPALRSDNFSSQFLFATCFFSILFNTMSFEMVDDDKRRDEEEKSSIGDPEVGDAEKGHAEEEVKRIPLDDHFGGGSDAEKDGTPEVDDVKEGAVEVLGDVKEGDAEDEVTRILVDDHAVEEERAAEEGSTSEVGDVKE
jgi:predicted outer membrane lipoprotein